MNCLPYIALLGIPVGICTLVYLAMAILKKQRDNRFQEACDRLSEEPSECEVDPLDSKDFDYVKGVLEKAVKIVREEAEDDAFYKQVQASITNSRPATLFERDLAKACEDPEYNTEFQKELNNIKEFDSLANEELELTDNELDELLISMEEVRQETKKVLKPKTKAKKTKKKEEESSVVPLYHFQCRSCNAKYRRILTPEESKVTFNCTQCSGILERKPTAPTSTTMERLDNTWMTEAIERPADVERLMAERNAKDPMEDK